MEQIHSPHRACSVTVVSCDKLLLGACPRKWGGFCLPRYVGFFISLIAWIGGMRSQPGHLRGTKPREEHADSPQVLEWMLQGLLQGQLCEASGSIWPSRRWECEICSTAPPVYILPAFATYFIAWCNVIFFICAQKQKTYIAPLKKKYINIVKILFHWGCQHQGAPCTFFYCSCVSWVTALTISQRLFEGPVQLQKATFL